MTTDRAGRPDERGVATVVALLVLLALTALAHASFERSRAELEAAKASSIRLRERLTLASALNRARWRLVASADSAVSPIRGGIDGVDYEVSFRAMGPELVLLEAVARAEGRRRGSTAARLAWRLDPLARVASLPAAVLHGGSLTGILSPPPPDTGEHEADEAGGCGAWAPRLEEAVGSGGQEGAARRVWSEFDPEGASGGGGAPTDSLPPLGALPGAEVLTRLGPWDPGLQDSLVGLPSVRAADGSLTLRDGVVLRGLLLVAGDLELDAGSRLEGVALVRGSIRVDPLAELVPHPCLAVRALAESRALLAPWIPSWGRWMEP